MKKNLETICIHGGWKPTKGEPQQLPIYQSTTFKYDTSEQMARLFDLKDNGYFFILDFEVDVFMGKIL